MNEAQKSGVSPDQVLSLTKPTQGFLCGLSDNTFGIQFTYFKIRSCDTNQTLCQIQKKPEDIGKPMSQNMRTIKYHFGPFFFQMKTIGTTLQFKVGDQPVKNFMMIERHYFKNQLIKSYQFQTPFCMPNSVNSMQAIYNLPEMDEQKIKQMIESPWQTVSDSFYFVQNKLMMHTKAQFSYAPFD